MPSMSVGVAWDRRAGRESIGYIPPATHLATIAAGALGYECGIAWREGCDLGTASSRLSGNRVFILCQLSDSVFAIALCCRRFRSAKRADNSLWWMSYELSQPISRQRFSAGRYVGIDASDESGLRASKNASM